MTYLTTAELSNRIKYDARTIRERLKDAVLIEGRHYIRPFGGRKILPMGNELVIIANPRRYRFKLRLRRAQATSGRRQALKPPASSPLISVLVGQ